MISEKISQLRVRYENERATLKRDHEKKIISFEAELKRVKAIDYYKPYRDRYANICNAMEEYYKKILKVEKDIHGLDYYSDKYMPKAVVLPFGSKNVEDMVEGIIKKCGEVVTALEAQHTLSEYAALSKSFCDLLATMRYVVTNSDGLLLKSGFPTADKAREVSKIEQVIEEENKKYSNVSKLENLKCYKDIVTLHDELTETYERSISELLGAVSLGDDGQYRYLIGYRVEKIAKAEVDFSENILGVSREKIGREPIYIQACTKKCNLIINAPGAFLSSKDCYELVRNIYFSVASRVDKNMLQFGCIECTKDRPRVRSIYTDIDTSSTAVKKRLGNEGKFCYNGVNVNAQFDLLRCLNTICQDANDFVDNFTNLKEYNLNTDKNKEPLKMVAVNLYPEGFVSEKAQSEQPYLEIQRVMEQYPDSGTFFVVCQNTGNPALKQSGVRINADKCNAVEITLTDESYKAWEKSGKPLSQCEFIIDGETAVLDIAVSGFDGDAYWDELKSFYAPKKVFDVDSVQKKSDIAENYREKQPAIFESGAIEASLGQYSGAYINV